MVRSYPVFVAEMRRAKVREVESDLREAEQVVRVRQLQADCARCLVVYGSHEYTATSQRARLILTSKPGLRTDCERLQKV